METLLGENYWVSGVPRLVAVTLVPDARLTKLYANAAVKNGTRARL